jgi:acyl carrier protein
MKLVDAARAFPGVSGAEIDMDGRMLIEATKLVSAPELRSWLREHAPASPIPAALRITYPSGATEEYVFRAPSTPNELAVASIWASVLGLAEVGVEDQFLDVGGDSLSAVEIASRINSEMGASVDGSMLFVHATVAEIAHELDSSS